MGLRAGEAGLILPEHILAARAGTAEAPAIPGIIPSEQELADAAAQVGVFTTTVGKVIAWGRYSSLWPALFGLACCAIEMMGASNARYDLSRFGAEVFRASPRQADMMIVAGRVSQKMGPVLRQIYDQMPDPKWVISMGACASCGGIFNNYAIIQGVDKVVPVDVYIPGCPPRPEGLLDAVIKLQKKIAATPVSSVRA
jgi:NADH-quinone oxidoreductase subunit B